MGILGSGLRDGLSLHPIRYPWAYDLYNQAVANTWFPNEVQLVQDLADFEKLSDDEKHALKTVISYLNPNELLINKSLAFGIYPYVNAAEAQLYLSKQMWEEANHFMTFEYIIETFPFDREEIYAAGFGKKSLADKAFAEEIRGLILQAVELEKAYNKDMLPKGILGLNADYVNQYVMHMTDRRLQELGFEPEYNVPNPAKWMAAANDTLELVNFFESTNTSYEVNTTK